MEGLIDDNVSEGEKEGSSSDSEDSEEGGSSSSGDEAEGVKKEKRKRSEFSWWCSV